MSANNAKFSSTEVKKVLIRCSGNISKAAKHLGCERQTVYNYIDRYKSVASALKKVRGNKRDYRILLAESNLDERLEAGEWKATEYVLSTLGKKYGYTRRTDVKYEEEASVVKLETSSEWIARMHKQAEAAGITLTN